MTQEEALARLKLMTDELDEPSADATGACACVQGASGRQFTDAQLESLLALHGQRVDAAAYDVLLRKAESSAVEVNGAAKMPDQRAYWLSRARSIRPDCTQAAGRADEV